MTTSNATSPSSGQKGQHGHEESRRPQKMRKEYDDSKNSHDENSNKSSSEIPQYGSQEYWEWRYKNHKAQKQYGGHDNTIHNDNDEKKHHIDADEDDEALLYHAWYFTYADLRPLILPLLLGEQLADEMLRLTSCHDSNHHDTSAINKEQVNGGDANHDGGESEDILQEEGDQADNVMRSTIEHPVENASDDDEEDCDEDHEKSRDAFEVDESEDEEGDDEDDDGPPAREGIAKDGPVSVLEIGCGDVPLGKDLIIDLIQLDTVSKNLSCFIEKVVCCDYSPTVIAAMEEKKQQIEGGIKLTAKNLSTLDKILTFETVDACKMPYAEKCFGLILEKGTLDALLSDKEVGVANCQSVITQCARVLAVGGSMVIISHLNAHTDGGIQWLDEVVHVGLRAGDKGASWEIEVHGNDGISHQLDEDNDDNAEPDAPGPCVYIIHKLQASEQTSTTSSKEVPTIPVRFFSY